MAGKEVGRSKSGGLEGVEEEKSGSVVCMMPN